MGISRHKITYDCDCGADYGSCYHKGIFVLETLRSADLYTIYHKYHSDVEGAEFKKLIVLTDNALDALSELLTGDDQEVFTDEEYNELNKIRRL